MDSGAVGGSVSGERRGERWDGGGRGSRGGDGRGEKRVRVDSYRP